MLLRAFLRLYRNRLITAAALALFLVCLTHMIITADSPIDVGIFWHHFCGCPVEPSDGVAVVSLLSFISVFIAAAIGFNQKPGFQVTALNNTRRFLLTRPVSKLQLQLYPLLLATAALALIPIAAEALLVGWLYLVHAPSLGHLIAAAELIPSASHLGPHPSLSALLHALHFGRRYLAALTVGLSIYTLFAASHWLLVSPNKWLRSSTFLVFLLIYCPVFLPKNWPILSTFLLTADRHNLAYLPSNLGIALHLAAAAVFLLAAQWTLREAEL